jgi:hypothetical protein
MYKILYNSVTNKPQSIRRLEDMAVIPMDENNMDYQAYLKWLEEGNEPLKD